MYFYCVAVAFTVYCLANGQCLQYYIVVYKMPLASYKMPEMFKVTNKNFKIKSTKKSTNKLESTKSTFYIKFLSMLEQE